MSSNESETPAPHDAATHTDPATPAKRGAGARLRSLLVFTILLIGAAFLVQSTTGIACGSTLPGVGLVTCAKPSAGDMKSWFDSRTEFIVTGREFSREKSTCEIAAMALREDASDRGFGRCMAEEQAAYDEAITAVRRDAATMLEYLDPGACRSAVMKWDVAARSIQTLAERVSSGTIKLSSGRVPARIAMAWNAATKAERAQSDAVVKACD